MIPRKHGTRITQKSFSNERGATSHKNQIHNLLIPLLFVKNARKLRKEKKEYEIKEKWESLVPLMILRIHDLLTLGWEWYYCTRYFLSEFLNCISMKNIIIPNFFLRVVLHLKKSIYLSNFHDSPGKCIYVICIVGWVVGSTQ